MASTSLCSLTYKIGVTTVSTSQGRGEGPRRHAGPPVLSSLGAYVGPAGGAKALRGLSDLQERQVLLSCHPGTREDTVTPAATQPSLPIGAPPATAAQQTGGRGGLGLSTRKAGVGTDVTRDDVTSPDRSSPPRGGWQAAAAARRGPPAAPAGRLGREEAGLGRAPRASLPQAPAEAAGVAMATRQHRRAPRPRIFCHDSGASENMFGN